MSSRAYGANVRLKYATLVNFVANALSLIVGLAFSVLIARKLSVDEFGIWTLMFRYIGYITPFAVIFTYWLPRTISRGFNTAKTGLSLAACLGTMASIIYVVIAIIASNTLGQPLAYLLPATFIVLLIYLERCLSSIASSHAPQFIGISGFVSRLARLLSAFAFVIYMKLGFLGAVAAALVARLSSVTLLYRVNRSIIKESRVSAKVAKEWLSKSWLPLFSNLASISTMFDAIVVRCLCGSDKPLAYYGVSMSLLEVTAASAYARPALYARLLAKGDVSDTVEAFWVAAMLSVPMSVGVLLYAELVSLVFGAKYSAISWVIRIFIISAILQIILSFLVTTLKGLEIRDLHGSSALTGTVLFKVPLVRLLSNAIYLPSVGIIAVIFKQNFINLLLSWGIAYNLKLLFELVIYDKLLRREFKVNLPYKVMGKYIFKFLTASLGIVLVRILMPIRETASIWAISTQFAIVAILSLLSYLFVLYVIDSKFRQMARRILARLIAF